MRLNYEFLVNFARVKKLPICLLLFLGLLASSCEQPELAVPPRQLMPKGQMVSTLIALHLLETRVDGARLPPDSARALYNELQKNLLWSQNISDSVFRQSYRYYAIHEKDLDDIYGQVIDSLSRRGGGGSPMPGRY